MKKKLKKNYAPKDPCFPSLCIVGTNCSQSQIKDDLALKLLSPCYKRIGSCLRLCMYRVMDALGKLGEHSRS